tara:strand:+ start:16033 stop:17364 length:1332 start_codon:yes stop_codon:yes gene_type:complete
MYRKIINPITNKQVNINSKLGQKVLKNYLMKIYKNNHISLIGSGNQEINFSLSNIYTIVLIYAFLDFLVSWLMRETVEEEEPEIEDSHRLRRQRRRRKSRRRLNGNFLLKNKKNRKNLDKTLNFCHDMIANQGTSFIPNFGDVPFFSLELEHVSIDVEDLIFPSNTLNGIGLQNALRPFFNKVSNGINSLQKFLPIVSGISIRLYTLITMVYSNFRMSWNHVLLLPSAWTIVLNNTHRNKLILLCLTGVYFSSLIYVDTTNQVVTFIRSTSIMHIADLITFFIPENIILNFRFEDYTLFSQNIPGIAIRDAVIRLVLAKILNKLLIMLDNRLQRGRNVPIQIEDLEDNDEETDQEGGGKDLLTIINNSNNNIKFLKNILLEKYSDINIKHDLLTIINDSNNYINILKEISHHFVDIKIKEKFTDYEVDLFNNEKKIFDSFIKV